MFVSENTHLKTGYSVLYGIKKKERLLSHTNTKKVIVTNLAAGSYTVLAYPVPTCLDTVTLRNLYYSKTSRGYKVANHITEGSNQPGFHRARHE